MNFLLKHNILKLLFIEIHKFKKNKILEENQEESNDQQSDAEQTGNEENVNNNLFAFLPKTAQSQVKATLDLRQAPLESQINMHSISKH